MDLPPTSPLAPPLAPPETDPRLRQAVRTGDRLRWGLTGLAAVFLVVLAAAAGLRPTGREDKPGTGEPLAVLGVAPGPATRPNDDQ
ncbi:hypothetical protein [Sandarakinorhabdus sp.]|uniref:hypothetical protein n=1 Tax=Sandarakinorhabdus sp. TaxID=1916663 RepID=UPI00286E7EE7|nr:hypothetical protein [Sandarakinorhabdus sp.]